MHVRGRGLKCSSGRWSCVFVFEALASSTSSSDNPLDKLLLTLKWIFFNYCNECLPIPWVLIILFFKLVFVRSRFILQRRWQYHLRFFIDKLENKWNHLGGGGSKKWKETRGTFASHFYGQHDCIDVYIILSAHWRKIKAFAILSLIYLFI